MNDAIPELKNAGVVQGPCWPIPEVCRNYETTYVLSYRWDYDEFCEYDNNDNIVDVYLLQYNSRQTLVFADKTTTKHNTYGSTDMMVFLDCINSGNLNHHWRIIMFGMLCLGAFQFTPKRTTMEYTQHTENISY